MSVKEIFEQFQIPLDHWFQLGFDALVNNFRPFFQMLSWPVDKLLNFLVSSLDTMPAGIFLVALFLLAWQFASFRVAIFAIFSMIVLGFVGLWDETMTTIAIIVSAVFFCVALGLPTGVLAARSNRVAALLRPVLDVMQTIPGFVYMVPIVMLFGLGNVPGVIVTIIFALPPVVRLTNLGLREVPDDIVEAARSFGASDFRILLRVQFPLATKTIMAGINQTIMMALAMVVYASMIAVQGLGLMVLRGIGRLDMGLGALGGFGIVVLAMVIDRLVQTSVSGSDAVGPWHQRGPVGLIGKWIGKMRNSISMRKQVATNSSARLR